MSLDTNEGDMSAEPKDPLQGPNRRKKPRYAADVKVEIFTKGLNHYVTGKTANISPGGLFVCTDYVGELGEKLHVRVILCDREAYFDCKATIAWICDDKGSHPQGLGVEFVELTDAQKHVINKVLKDYVNVRDR
jgi:Tfp pilus assembly protein PilZ